VTMIREKGATTVSGIPMLLFLILALIASLWGFINAAQAHEGGRVIAMLTAIVIVFTGFFGLTIVNPNEAQVVTLFGNYTGSVRRAGLWWVNPFTLRKRVSLRIRNFESAKLKVNDHDGNPIEIAAVVVWRVVDSAEAMFEVDNYQEFVSVQSEAALRNLATTHAYDSHIDGATSLRGNTAEIADDLRKEIQARLEKAGVEVIESRISHLAYASEIAGAMLRRQQASAIVAARQKFVEGAVGMVEMALDQLKARGVVELDDERKAAMVSNMLVVLCSDQHTQPVVNTGTLYH
jgi:regulator of protease activity HflC (stomatin/prohibitin superfamily)